jgi:L-alanine-DL-glutamate epimerase-like enolase superfamily enzyme
MKITGFESYFFEYPLEKEFHPAWIPGHAQTANRCVILKILSDVGIEGIAAASVFSEEQARLGKFIAVDTIGRFFIGMDPADTEVLNRVMNLYGFMLGGRPWLLEVALWDMLGKAMNQPLYKLWGGTASRIEVYASTGETATPQGSPEKALAAREAGFRAVKLRAHSFDHREDVRAVEAVRAAVGDSMKILIDANQGWTLSPIGPRWDFDTALDFARGIADLDVYWLEEPLDRFDFNGLRRLRDSSSVRIAGGELNQGIHEFQILLEKDCLDVYQPDATLAGGVTVARKVAELARAQGREFSPHTWTNGLGFAINLQIAASIPDCPIIEFPYEPESWSPQARDAMLTEPFIPRNGYLDVPEKPGLGVELSPEAMSRYAKKI